MQKGVTFVSCILPDIHKEQNIREFVDWVKKLHIQIIIYVHPHLTDGVCSGWPNVRFIPYCPNENHGEEMGIFSYCSLHKKQLGLPIHRNPQKDTFEYILASHYKHELLERATQTNYFGSSHFGWLDCDCIEFMGGNNTSAFMRWCSGSFCCDYENGQNADASAGYGISMGGCWDKLSADDPTSVNKVIRSVYWRFCGMFFVGDIQSIISLCVLHKKHIYLFLKEYKTLIWDFNFWAWLEMVVPEKECPIKWYRADHNSSLFYGITADLYAQPIHSSRAFGKGTKYITSVKYNYPNIPDFTPSSASYLYVPETGSHWLNTRYVNYWIYPDGYYLFHNPKKTIENKNVLSLLSGGSPYPFGDAETDAEPKPKPKTLFMPLYYKEIDETKLGLLHLHEHGEINSNYTEKKRIGSPTEEEEEEKDENDNNDGEWCLSLGLEDIRMFVCNKKIQFIASTIGYGIYSSCSQIVIGDYDVKTGKLTNGHLIFSPNETAEETSEKNWIPIPVLHGEENPLINGMDADADINTNAEEHLRIIYGWYPFQVGIVTDITTETNSPHKSHKKLKIIKSVNIQNPIFSKIRGSSTFINVQKKDIKEIWDDLCNFMEDEENEKETPDEENDEETDEYLLGVVHYSEEHSPRHYYHLLVLIKKRTLCPFKYSYPFYFEKLGIEFCIGFSLVAPSHDNAEEEKAFYFWISRHDRDPILLGVPLLSNFSQTASSGIIADNNNRK